MKIGGEEVKQEKHDEGEESDPATTVGGEEEVPRGSGIATPAGNEAASASSGQVLTAEVKNEEEKDPADLVLPKWDDGRPKKKSRTKRSASKTPEHGKEEEKDAEDKRQKKA